MVTNEESEFSALIESALREPWTSATRYEAIKAWLSERLAAPVNRINVSYVAGGSKNFRNRLGQAGFQQSRALGVALLDDQRHLDAAADFVREWMHEGRFVGPIALAAASDGSWRLRYLIEVEGSDAGGLLRDDFPELVIEDVAPTPARSLEATGAGEPRIWFEITNRPDIGQDLRAPQRGETGQAVWSYSLVKDVQPGDVVVHYDTNAAAITGVSRVAGPSEDGIVTWGALTGDVDPYDRPGWIAPLVAFTTLDGPIELDKIRARGVEIKAVHRALLDGQGAPLYFPFEVGDKRPMRAAQAYLTKFPSELLDVFPELAGALDELPHAVSDGRTAPTSLDELAGDLCLTPEFLREIERLLVDKGQIIFYGPPGTGKTFVARELARWIAGDAERTELVQFHPSYSYEDFVEGYRPVLRDGAAGFRLHPGPLRVMAEQAVAHTDKRYVLIIDEINRGDLAKVLGELYFLLEYRDEEIVLLYSEQRFALPENLVIIGTMNTADRSIALLDAALRRRFYFFGFFPDSAPIDAMLRCWLGRNNPAFLWVADLVDLANSKIDDRHGRIGPSYFMRKDLNDAWIELIWQHSIMPYLEEQFFGEEDRLADFEYPHLRAQLQVALNEIEIADGSAPTA